MIFLAGTAAAFSGAAARFILRVMMIRGGGTAIASAGELATTVTATGDAVVVLVVTEGSSTRLALNFS